MIQTNLRENEPVFTSIPRFAIVAVALMLSFTQSVLAVDMYFGNMKANNILFLGNSITLHPPKADINWMHNWGMAASVPENDFVHLLASSIDGQTGGTLSLDPTDPAVTNPDGTIVVGDANIVNICGQIEWGYATYDNSMLEQQISARPDIVVLEFGENVNMSTFDGMKLKNSVRSLLDALEAAGNPNIFITSCILGENTQIDDIKKQLCAEDPAHRVFVDLGGFRLDGSNLALAEPYYQDSPFVLGHPGDKGMRFIADHLFEAMRANSIPEPSISVLIVYGGLSVGCRSFWRRRIKQLRNR